MFINSTNVGNTTLVHELKHAYQFETGTLSFSLRAGYGGIYYDYHDEVEAFKRVSIFGGPAKPNSMYTPERFEGHKSGPVPIARYFDNTFNDIFRIGRILTIRKDRR